MPPKMILREINIMVKINKNETLMPNYMRIVNSYGPPPGILYSIKNDY